MHSVVINRYPYPSSLHRYAMNLFEGSAGDSSLVNIVTNSPKWSNPHIGQDVKVAFHKNFYISGLMSRRTFGNASRLITEIRRSRENVVVHLAAPFADPSFVRGFPVTVTIHDSPEAMFIKGQYRRLSEPLTSYSRRMRLTRMLYSRAMKLPYLCVDSNHVALALKEYGYEGETYVLHPPVSGIFQQIPDKTEARKRLGLPLNRKLILSVSIDEVRKNLDMVKKVMTASKDWASVVRLGSDIGSGYTFSNVDNDTLNLVYNSCDLLLIPSLEEGFGYPVVEAFKVGIPVVASDIEIFREVAGDAAVFVDPLNVEDVMRGIREAIDRRDFFSQKGSERVAQFQMGEFSRKLKIMYDQIVAKF